MFRLNSRTLPRRKSINSAEKVAEMFAEKYAGVGRSLIHSLSKTLTDPWKVDVSIGIFLGMFRACPCQSSFKSVLVEYTINPYADPYNRHDIDTTNSLQLPHLNSPWFFLATSSKVNLSLFNFLTKLNFPPVEFTSPPFSLKKPDHNLFQKRLKRMNVPILSPSTHVAQLPQQN